MALNSLKLGQDRALFLGELPATGWHRHACPVLLVGLSGRFAVHWQDGRVESCRSALIDAGVEHVFDSLGETVAVMYLEPDSREAQALRYRFLQHQPVIFDPVVGPVITGGIERSLRRFDVQTLFGPSLPDLTAPPMDRRILHCLSVLRRPGEALADRSGLASVVGLSASRFNHVFRAQMGTSYRSYRVWSQVRAALLGFSAGGSLTQAAHFGGFSDSPHFSNTFRQTFAMTPSSVLKPLRSIEVIR